MVSEKMKVDSLYFYVCKLQLALNEWTVQQMFQNSLNIITWNWRSPNITNAVRPQY